MTLLSIHCQPGTAYHARQNHHYCSGDRGIDQPCYCACHFPAPGRTWKCDHAPRLPRLPGPWRKQLDKPA